MAASAVVLCTCADSVIGSCSWLSQHVKIKNWIELFKDFLTLRHISKCEPGSSVSIVSGYGLDERAIEFRSPAEAKGFSSSLCVQTGSGAHPASCTMGTGGPFPWAKTRPERDADHPPHLVPRSRMSRSYISSPPWAPSWRVVGLL
jgi:hypothetical protein